MITRISYILAILGVWLAGFSTYAGQYYSGQTGEKVTFEEVMNHTREGQVIIVSESHAYTPHNENQREILKELVRRGIFYSVGMEFFDYTQQNIVSDYIYDKLDEDEFKKAIGWSPKIPFENYRFQIRFPRYIDGKTFAMNLPRRITGQVAKFGLDSLSNEDRNLLPPGFEVGRDSYYERFQEVMRTHVPAERMRDNFVAQSLWDDTMAWRAERIFTNYRDHSLVIIVGDFHVAYQDGLIARLKARGVTDILSISQVSGEGLTPAEIQQMVRPDSKYGARADFVFVAP